MPRIKISFQSPPRKIDKNLVEKLAAELKSGNVFGQPFIYEEEFSTQKIRMLVIWDAWDNLSLEQRTSIILAAVEKADGEEYRTRVALANGLTMAEGAAAGILPFGITALVRKTDPVSVDQCKQTMLEEGGTTLISEGVQLRFPTEESAQACLERLKKRLPQSDDVWLLTQEVSNSNFAEVG